MKIILVDCKLPFSPISWPPCYLLAPVRTQQIYRSHEPCTDTCSWPVCTQDGRFSLVALPCYHRRGSRIGLSPPPRHRRHRATVAAAPVSSPPRQERQDETCRCHMLLCHVTQTLRKMAALIVTPSSPRADG